MGTTLQFRHSSKLKEQFTNKYKFRHYLLTFIPMENWVKSLKLHDKTALQRSPKHLKQMGTCFNGCLGERCNTVCCEAPEMFCGLHSFTRLSTSARASCWIFNFVRTVPLSRLNVFILTSMTFKRKQNFFDAAVLPLSPRSFVSLYLRKCSFPKAVSDGS